VRSWRWVIAVGIVAGTAAVLLTALNNDSDGPPETTTTMTTSTTSSTLASVTTTTEPITSVTTQEQRLAEVEELLQDLWFGWFDAIYRKDEEALWRVVATADKHAEGVSAMAFASFESVPTRQGVVVRSLEILLDRPDCLVVFSELDVTEFRGEGATSSGVDVLWPDPRYGWRQATSWINRNDIWLHDCDNLERDVTP
jgi:hypothetical protein